MTGSPNYFLLLDAVMAAVIWAVQLLVYPGFAYYSREGLQLWHKAYTRRISLLVAPLMLAQLGFGVFWALSEPGGASLGYFAIVALLWAITFRAFVPIHQRIGQGNASARELARLVSLNRIRTFLWTLLFLWHLGFEGLSPA